MLEYPGIPGYNRWKQSIFPTKEPNNISKSAATGYSPVSISWNGSFWGGLSRSISIYALLDGSFDKKSQNFAWYYVVGFLSTCSISSYQKVFPGPSTTVNTVLLWMRIPDIEASFFCTASNIHSSLPRFIFVLFYTLNT